jgi:hypothetical protein
MTDRGIAPSTLDSETVDTFARTAQRSTSRPHREAQERVRRLQPSPSQIAQAWSGRFRVPLLPSSKGMTIFLIATMGPPLVMLLLVLFALVLLTGKFGEN